MADTSGVAGWVKDPVTNKWKSTKDVFLKYSQEGAPPDVKGVIAKGTMFKVKSLAFDNHGAFVYMVKGSKNKSKYPAWVKPGVHVTYMSHDHDYWIRCHKTDDPKSSWHFPYTDLALTLHSAAVSYHSSSAASSGYPKHPPKPKPKPKENKVFLSKLPEAEELMKQMLQLTGQCATDLHSTAGLSDPYKEKDVATAWTEQVNSLQAQLVGWSMDLQEKLEDAELAIEKEEIEEIRKNATLDFFAGDADY